MFVWCVCDVAVLSSEWFDTSVGSSGPASPAPSPVPDMDYQVPDTGSIKEVGFYLLRKDSERRSTLVRVMTEDQEAVSVDYLLGHFTGSQWGAVLGGTKTSDVNPRAKPRPRPELQGRGQFLEVEAKAEAKNNYEKVPNND